MRTIMHIDIENVIDDIYTDVRLNSINNNLKNCLFHITTNSTKNFSLNILEKIMKSNCQIKENEEINENTDIENFYAFEYLLFNIFDEYLLLKILISVDDIIICSCSKYFKGQITIKKSGYDEEYQKKYTIANIYEIFEDHVKRDFCKQLYQTVYNNQKTDILIITQNHY